LASLSLSKSRELKKRIQENRDNQKKSGVFILVCDLSFIRGKQNRGRGRESKKDVHGLHLKKADPHMGRGN
jgi:hypothetical protein